MQFVRPSKSAYQIGDMRLYMCLTKRLLTCNWKVLLLAKVAFFVGEAVRGETVKNSVQNFI